MDFSMAYSLRRKYPRGKRAAEESKEAYEERLMCDWFLGLTSVGITHFGLRRILNQVQATSDSGTGFPSVFLL